MKTIVLAGLVALLAAPVAAQTAAPEVAQTPVQTPAQSPATAEASARAGDLDNQPVPARWEGLTLADVVSRLLAAGLTMDAPQMRDDRVYLRVHDGDIRWVLTLFSCTNGSCPDVQFTAVFSGVNATPEIVSRWNGARRFVKAFHAVPDEADADPQAVAQYDVLFSRGAGAEQLDDPIRIWRNLILDLGRTVTTPPAGAATTPPAE